ncbi:ABC transporter substrate-binding protein [Streptomyces sp. NPDC008343]|uniref:ABC transporter substrate-binding protein n=1 Tax=Streptomyces sp. NPDC008343 TaxID=3364828 RepID=UPI0036EB5A2C
MRAFSSRTWGSAAAGALIVAGAACSGPSTSGSVGDGTGTVSVWFHSGQGAERETLQQQVRQFNDSQDRITVKLTLLPEGSYNEQVQAAAASGELPDLLDFDGPMLYSYVYKGKLTALDAEGLVSQRARTNLLPSIDAQGTFDGNLYGVGTFDSGLGLYGNKRLLDAAGVDYPKNAQETWSAAEFTAALKALAGPDSDGQVLDFGLANGKGEWLTYGYSPIVWSAGGDLIDRSGYRTSRNVLDSPEVVRAMRTVQSWKRYIDPDTDANSFASGRTALSWNGHWQYPTFDKALERDLVVLPLPDFGNGTKTGSGSWNWGITKSSENKKAAAAFLEYLLKDEQVLAMSRANGAIPATRTALAESPLYAKGKPLHRFADQLSRSCGTDPVSHACVSVPRPLTPAYPVITQAFQKAFQNIYDGESPEKALAGAVNTIDTDLADNDGYPMP